MRSRLLRHLRPVIQEPLQPDIGQGVLRHLLQHVERHRDDIRAEFRRLDHVEWVSDRCDEDLAVPVVVPEDLDDLADDLHALLAHIVQAADERTHVLRACFRGEDRLIRREDQGRVDLHALRGKGFDRLEALRGHLNLHDDVLVELRELATLLDHLVRLRRRDLQGDRAVDEGEDVLDDLGPLAARLRDERRIRRDAVEDAPGSGFADLLDVRGVQENLHHMRAVDRWREPDMSISASWETLSAAWRGNVLIRAGGARASLGSADPVAPSELPETLDWSERIAIREPVHRDRAAVPRGEGTSRKPGPGR